MGLRLEHLCVVETCSETQVFRHVYEGNVVRGVLQAQALPGPLTTLDIAVEHDGVVHVYEAALESFESE